MSLNEENFLSDYDKAKAALEETLVNLQPGDIDLIPALLVMGNVYAEIVTSNLPHEIALEFVVGIKLVIILISVEVLRLYLDAQHRQQLRNEVQNIYGLIDNLLDAVAPGAPRG